MIAQREIVIEEEKRKNDELTKSNSKLKQQLEDLQKLKASKEDAAAKEIGNLVQRPSRRTWHCSSWNPRWKSSSTRRAKSSSC